MKAARDGGFCDELLSENDFEAVLVNLCCYGYCAHASEGVQKTSTRTLLEVFQLTKTANFIATPMKINIQLFITCLLEIQVRFDFFLTKKMSNLLHVGLILIITKVFTILCLLFLCRNREYLDNFQNETLISKFLFQISVQVK